MLRGKVVVFGLALVALIGGCGSSDSDSLTKAEFVEQGNAICREAAKNKDAAIFAYLKENQRSKPTPELERTLVVSVAMPPIQTMHEELDELEAPSDDEEQVDAIVSAYAGGIEKIEADPVGALAGSRQPFSEADKLAARYGLSSCAEI